MSKVLQIDNNAKQNELSPAAVSCPSGWIPDAEGKDCFKFTNKSEDSAGDSWDESFCDSLLQDSELAVLEDDNLVDLVRLAFPMRIVVYFDLNTSFFRGFIDRIDDIQWFCLSKATYSQSPIP